MAADTTTAPPPPKPLPPRNAISAPFWDAAKRHEFVLQCCDECSHRWYPPQTSCPKCLSLKVSWKPAKPTGKVWAKCRFHRAYFKSFADDIPYTAVTVQLDEHGIFYMSNMVGVAWEDIEVGMPVRVAYDDVSDTTTLIKFVLDGAGR